MGDGFQASPSMAPGLLAFLDCGGKLDVSWQRFGGLVGNSWKVLR